MLIKLLQEHIIYAFDSKNNLLWLAFALSAPDGDKSKYFFHLNVNSNLQLINGISSNYLSISDIT